MMKTPEDTPEQLANVHNTDPWWYQRYIDRHGINKQTVTNLTDGFIVYTAIVTSEVLFVRYFLSVESVDRDRIRLPWQDHTLNWLDQRCWDWKLLFISRKLLTEDFTQMMLKKKSKIFILQPITTVISWWIDGCPQTRIQYNCSK